MAGKNPLTNPPAGTRKGGDFVQSPDAGAKGKGTDFVNNPEGTQAKAKGKDFVAVTREQPQGRAAGGAAAHQADASVPEGGLMTPEAVDSSGVPGAPAQGVGHQLRQGPAQSPKPFKLRGA